MSLTAASPASTPVLDEPARAPRPWRDAGRAVVVAATVVAAGEMFGYGVYDIAARLGLDLDLMRLRVLHPGIVASYQLALLLAMLNWLHGPARGQVVAWVWPRLHLWQWIAIIVGLYGLKAAVTVGLFAIAGVPPAAPGAGASAPAALAPFALLLKSPWWPAMIVAGVVAAIVEELLYRGYLSRTLEATRLGFWGGAATASAIWALLHIYYPWPIIGALVVVGIALSWLRRWSGSVVPGMLWHILNNTAALLALRVMG